jgi:MotA/TolQ/ExbB proton channel family protein
MTERRLDSANRAPLLHWMIFTGVSLFAVVLLWRFGLIRRMVVADRTGISSFIALLYVGTTLHCLWRIVAVSRESDAARRAALLLGHGGQRVVVTGDAVEIVGAGPLPQGLIAAHLRDLALQAERQGARRLDPTLLLRALAVRLRGSNQFGGFASDTLMKLGLVGTIVGFIMMLAPIADIDTGDRGAIRSSMNLMSDGMAVAMYTTLVGLVGSILVRIQYYMLDEATAKLFAFALGLVEVYVASLPETPSDRRE